MNIAFSIVAVVALCLFVKFGRSIFIGLFISGGSSIAIAYVVDLAARHLPGFLGSLFGWLSRSKPFLIVMAVWFIGSFLFFTYSFAMAGYDGWRRRRERASSNAFWEGYLRRHSQSSTGGSSPWSIFDPAGPSPSPQTTSAPDNSYQRYYAQQEAAYLAGVARDRAAYNPNSLQTTDAVNRANQARWRADNM